MAGRGTTPLKAGTLNLRAPGLSGRLGLTLLIALAASVSFSLAGVAVEDGFQSYDQGSSALYEDLGYHEFEALAQEAEEAPRMVATAPAVRHAARPPRDAALAVAPLPDRYSLPDPPPLVDGGVKNPPSTAAHL